MQPDHTCIFRGLAARTQAREHPPRLSLSLSRAHTVQYTFTHTHTLASTHPPTYRPAHAKAPTQPHHFPPYPPHAPLVRWLCETDWGGGDCLLTITPKGGGKEGGGWGCRDYREGERKRWRRKWGKETKELTVPIRYCGWIKGDKKLRMNTYT